MAECVQFHPVALGPFVLPKCPTVAGFALHGGGSGHRGGFVALAVEFYGAVPRHSGGERVFFVGRAELRDPLVLVCQKAGRSWAAIRTLGMIRTARMRGRTGFGSARDSEECCGLAVLFFANGFLESSAKIIGAGEAATARVASRIGDAQYHGLKLFDVLNLADEVQAEAIPFAGMFVVEMLFDAVSEVCSETDVVEEIAFVEGVDAMLAVNEVGDLAWVVGEGIGGNALDEAEYERAGAMFLLFHYSVGANPCSRLRPFDTLLSVEGE